MKVIAFILSAYLVFLIAIPCCAFDNCPEEKIAQESNHEKDDGPALPAGSDCGSCSPFFTCTGCSGFTVSFENTDIQMVSHFSGHQYTGYIVSPISEVHYDFWQPPKPVARSKS